MKSLINTALVDDYIASNKMSRKQFCKKCGIGISEFSKIMTQTYGFKESVIVKIATTIGKDVEQLLIL